MFISVVVGLFHKAICQSGSALSSWAYAHKQDELLKKALGLDNNLSEAELLKYLQQASVEEIFEAQCKIDKVRYGTLLGKLF